MTRPIVLRQVARTEFDEAVDWYERQRSGLGAEFVVEVHQMLARIGERPSSFALVVEDVRRAVVRRFPFTIYYRVEAIRIVVLAVFHSSRDPDVWQARLSRGDFSQ